jgi:hypothetical protein
MPVRSYKDKVKLKMQVCKYQKFYTKNVASNATIINYELIESIWMDTVLT